MPINDYRDELLDNALRRNQELAAENLELRENNQAMFQSYEQERRMRKRAERAVSMSAMIATGLVTIVVAGWIFWVTS